MIFSPQSKVWIYQSNRKFSTDEVIEIQEILNEFTHQWKAHGNQLKAKGEIFHHYFIVITVDEDVANTTGCSVDASVRLMKDIEQKFDLDLFNRFNMAYLEDEEVHVVGKEDFETLIAAKKIDRNTIVFNNLVNNLADFDQKWQVPIKDSWHNNIFAEHLNI